MLLTFRAPAIMSKPATLSSSSAQASTEHSSTLPDPPRTLEIAGDGKIRTMPTPTSTLMRRFSLRYPYRLYRFLSDLDDAVTSIRSDRDRLRVITTLVRHLLNQSSWITEACPSPDPRLGWAVHFLYDEPGYPFTIQVVSWIPGQTSPIHNHGGWGIVSLLGDPLKAGRERNRIWQRLDDGSQEGYAEVKQVSEILLHPGDLVAFTPEAIHSVEAVAADTNDPQPTLTFNLYGDTDFDDRYEFDPQHNTAKPF